MNPTVLPLLVSLRWLAVFMVVLSHVRFMLFANFSQLNEPGPLLKLFYFLTNYGHEGYALYMLLSGVMLGGTSYRRRHAGPSAFGHFKTRMLWFYALLAPALAMGAVLDIFGSRALGASGAYAHFHEFSPAFDLGAFTANFLMVQRFLVPGLGSNAVLFILAFECWAYLSLAAYVLPGRRRLATLAATSIAVAGIALEPEFAGYLMLWLFGLVLAKAGDWPRPSRATAWLVFVGTLLISRFGGAGLAQVPEHYVLVSRLLLDLQLVLGCAVLLIASRACVRQRSGQPYLAADPALSRCPRRNLRDAFPIHDVRCRRRPLWLRPADRWRPLAEGFRRVCLPGDRDIRIWVRVLSPRIFHLAAATRAPGRASPRRYMTHPLQSTERLRVPAESVCVNRLREAPSVAIQLNGTGPRGTLPESTSQSRCHALVL
jgi:hypothetical protein